MLAKLCDHFGDDRDLAAITSEEILSFLNKITEGGKQQTKHGRYSHLKACFTFIKTSLDPTMQNPCDAPMLRKIYRLGKPVHRDVVEKETIDGIIFRTTKARNRLILELMARGGMRVGEVLKPTPRDVNDQNLTIQNPKGGKEAEAVFIPGKVVSWLRVYVKDKAIEPERRIFPITYAAVRMIVKKAGKLAGIQLRPHDLRRNAATYASRSGVPLEIVSKVIPRHSNLSITQRYPGNISDSEATRWIENLYGLTQGRGDHGGFPG